MKRVKGVTVTPHYCPIQDKDGAWYKQFQIIVMGLDSIEVWTSGDSPPPRPSHPPATDACCLPLNSVCPNRAVRAICHAAMCRAV